jgi:hypothetical protein
MESGEAHSGGMSGGGIGHVGGVATDNAWARHSTHLSPTSSHQPAFSRQYDDGDDKQYKRDLPLKSLAWKVSPAALSIFLSVGTSMLVFPFFTYVHSTGLLGERLPQV